MGTVCLNIANIKCTKQIYINTNRNNMAHQLLFFGNLGAPEITIIALVILLLFGGKKIPELMRGLGKGVSQFKKGMNEIEQEINADPEQNKEIQNK